MIAGKIKEMKLRSGMTNQQVADKSGVPIGTVNRVMADQVQNPNFETISAIVMALGGSIDEVVGHTPTVAAPVETAEPEKSSQPSQAVAQERPQQKESTPDHVSSDLVRGYEMLLEERNAHPAPKAGRYHHDPQERADHCCGVVFQPQRHRNIPRQAAENDTSR